MMKSNLSLIMMFWLAQSFKSSVGFIACTKTIQRLNDRFHFTDNLKKASAQCEEDIKEVLESLIPSKPQKEEKIVHFNNAGASPSPTPVLKTLFHHYLLEQRYDAYHAASLQSSNLQNVYTSIQKLIQCQSSDEIALTESASVAWTRIFYSLIKSRKTKKRDILLCSEIEYAANVVALQQVATENDFKLLVLPRLGDTGIVNVTELENILNGSNENVDPDCIFMVCVTHIPTNCGVINPVDDIGKAIYQYNSRQQQSSEEDDQIFYLVDGCQSVGQIPIQVQHMKCHALTATGRKFLRAPRGTGFLFVKQDLLEKINVDHVDHYSSPVQNVNQKKEVKSQYRKGAKRFEFWESNIAARLGLGTAIDYALEEVGIETIQKKCQYLGEELRLRLREKFPNLYIHHEKTKEQCAIITFFVENRTSEDVVQELFQKFGILSTIVPATSTPFDSINNKLLLESNDVSNKNQEMNFSIPKDLVRVSLSYFNTIDEIEYLCTSLNSVLK